MYQFPIKRPLIGLVLLAVIFAGCSRKDTSIRIAAVGPLTGPSAPRGQDLKQAVQMAVDEANAAGGLNGHRVTMDLYDDEDQPTRAREFAEKIATTRAIAVLGQVASSAGKSAGQVYKARGIPAITAAASEAAVTQGNDWFFRLFRNAAGQGEFMADLALYTQGTREIAVIREIGTSGNEFATAFRDHAKSKKIRIAADIEMEPADANDTSRLDAIIAKLAKVPKGDLIVLGTQFDETPIVLGALRDKRGPFPSMGYSSQASQTLADYFVKDEKKRHVPVGYYTDGFTVAAPQLGDIAEYAQTVFATRYQQRYHVFPTPEAVRWYEGAQLIFQAVAAKQITGADIRGDRQRVRDWLASLESPDTAVAGVGGPVYFDRDHNVQRGISVGTFYEGRLISAPYQLTKVSDPLRVPGFNALQAADMVIDDGGLKLIKTPVVYAGIDLNSLDEINSATNTFAAGFFIWFRFLDDLSIDLHQVEFPTSVSDGQLGKQVSSRSSGGYTTATYPVRAVFHADYEFSRFPFDVQALRIPIQIRNTNSYSLILAYAKTTHAAKPPGRAGAPAADPILTSRLWRIQDQLFYRDVVAHDASFGDEGDGGEGSAVETNRVNSLTFISRDVLGFAIKNFLPLVCILVAILIGYALAPTMIDARISLGVTALLTTSVLYQKLASDLPTVTYIIAMDYVFFAFFAMCVIFLALTVVTASLQKNEKVKLGHTVNVAGMVLTVLGLGGTLLFVWVRYWSAA